MRVLVLIPLLFVFAFAKEVQTAPPKTDFLRVEENETAAKLQTANTTYTKEGFSVTLIGAVHIADETYYEALNNEFKNYDRLLYEMIGGEELPKMIKEGNTDNDHILARTYALIARFLKLTEQKLYSGELRTWGSHNE